MPRVMIIARDKKPFAELRSKLAKDGLDGSFIELDEKAAEAVSLRLPDLLLIETGILDPIELESIRILKGDKQLPVIALATGRLPGAPGGYLKIDDFVIPPFKPEEVSFRIRRLLNRFQKESADLITSDGMVIDLVNCEVTIGGKPVELTFKEYELLKLLAANKGRVYTREDLLNKIWGYEYFGGDRTVDVHIRRLRSKIEGPTDTFIETVRNIGYRFKKDS